MSDKKLEFLITAKDEATGVLQKVSGTFTQIGTVIADVAKAAAGITVDAFRWALDTVKPAEALERQLGKVEQALRNAGVESELTAQQVDALARELDEASLGSAASFRDAAAQLIGFGVTSEDSLRRVLTAAQDLSEAGFGSMEANATRLGRALQDPVKGMQLLERAGVSLSNEQKELVQQFVRVGDLASAQNVILGEVESRYGGLAAAAGGGLAGALDLVGKRITDFKEILGGVLAPVLTALTTAFAGIIGTVNETAQRLAGPLKEASEQAGTALRTLGEGVAQFLGDALQKLGDWISGLDWASLQQGAENASTKIAELWQKFVDVGQAVKDFADVVKVAFNGVQIAFNTVVGGIQTLVGGFLEGLSVVERQAARVGLGTLERSNELKARAEEWKAYAAESAAAIARDAGQAGEALDRLSRNTDGAAAAQQGLKDALPDAELQEINRTLADYEGLAARANAATEQAARDQAAGKITAADYGVALLDAASAQEDLTAAQERQLTLDTVAKIKEEKAERITAVAAINAQISAAEEEIKTLGKGDQARRRALEAERDLAEAKGDSAAASRLAKELADDEITAADRIAEAKRREATLRREALDAINAQIAAGDDLNGNLAEQVIGLEAAAEATEYAAREAEANAASTKLQADESTNLANRLNAEADAHRALLGPITQEREERGKAAAAARAQAQATKENAEAAEKAAAAQKKLADATEATKKQGGLASSIINGWNKRLGELSEKAKEAFGRVALGSDAARAGIAKATDAMELMRVATRNLAAGGFITWANRLAIQALKVELAFKSQADQAERLTDRLNTMQGATAGAMDTMIRQAEVARDRMDLLDETRLSNLQAAIDGARDRLRALAEQADEARDALARLNAEIAAEKGDDETARRLALEIEQRQRLGELEKNLEAARASGNRELVTLLEQQRAKLNDLYRLKERNLETDLQAERSGERTRSKISEVADEAERAERALTKLGGANLGGLVNQTGQLTKNMSDLNAIL